MNIDIKYSEILHNVQVLDEKKVDLSRLLIDLYGDKYIGHPRLESIIDLNNISKKDFLNGKQELEAWENQDFVRLHQSTLRKVDILSNLLNKIHNKKLKNMTPCREKLYLHPKIIIEKLKEHWIISLISILLLLSKTAPYIKEIINYLMNLKEYK